jgi:hypothetical protein
VPADPWGTGQTLEWLAASPPDVAGIGPIEPVLSAEPCPRRQGARRRRARGGGSLMATSYVTIEDLGPLPPPVPARPRVLLVGTVLACAAIVAVFAGLIGIYLASRAE